MKTSNRKIKKIIILTIGVLLLAVIGVSSFLSMKFTVVNEKPSVANSAPSDVGNDAATLVSIVGKLIMLPESEIPTIASVSDPAMLKSQTFFINSAIGDKVLIFTQAKKAILYRPSVNQIIEVGTINLDSTSNTTQTSLKNR